MKATTKLLSTLLTVILLIGVFANFTVLNTAAAPTDEEEKSPDEILEETVLAYLTTKYATPQAKLQTMTLKLDSKPNDKNSGYQLYIDELSGEVATLDKASGQILFSNPWDIADDTASETVKKQHLSQICVKYSTPVGGAKELWSFEESATRGQITVKNIKNGVRVEYTVGREEAKKLVPRWISVERFDSLIRPYIEAAFPGDKWSQDKVLTYWNEQNPSKETSETIIKDMHKNYPITKIKPIYVLDSSTSATELSRLEEAIKTHCPHYTYEEMEWDHTDCAYEGTDSNPPLFKLAIEYSLDEWGLVWTVPVNGLRFDEGTYTLESLTILPFMGCGAEFTGSNKDKLQEGYTFFPDGSGTILDFQDLNVASTTTLQSKIYGEDYALHTITGQLREAVRYPVFGMVEQQHMRKTVTQTVEKTPESIDPETGEKIPAVYEDILVSLNYTEDRGYVAILEEGDALATIKATHNGTKSKYNWVQLDFTPRPSDSFIVGDAISGASNQSLTVTSSRRYVGNYKVRYIMLTDSTIAENNGLVDSYPCSWLGMARAYSDFLVSKGELSRLTAADIEEEYIPLYIETFGTFETLEKILSVPVNVMTPLTTFDDVETMYDELSEEGVKNIQFKLNGYANGGMFGRMPYKLKWEKAVGGKEGFEDLLAYAKEINAKGDGSNLGIYPDFNFVYAHQRGFGDGLNMKKHAVRTIDDRYIGLRKYSATYQEYIGYYGMAISPAYMSHFYDKFAEEYLTYDPIGISVSLLASDLNSDFDEDEPYNREDSKNFVTKLLAQIDKDYDKVMAEYGNAYSWKYVDHLLNIPLDSSRYTFSSNAVPFIGVVLHGYVQFAGTPYNMEGNTNYAFLKAIENGASLYFTLTYQNSQKFKEYQDLSMYYSVSYEIWFEELCEVYTKLNEALKDVQTNIIIDHQFLKGERVPDIEELEADILELANKAIASEDAAIVEAGIQAQQAVYKARQNIVLSSQKTLENINSIDSKFAAIQTAYEAVGKVLAEIKAAEQDIEDKLAPIAGLEAAMEEAERAFNEARDLLQAANKEKADLTSELRKALTAAKPFRDQAEKLDDYAPLKEAVTTATAELQTAKKAYDDAVKAGDEALIAEKLALYNAADAALDTAKAAAEAFIKNYCDNLSAEAMAANDEYVRVNTAYELVSDLVVVRTDDATAKSKVYTDATNAHKEAVADHTKAVATLKSKTTELNQRVMALYSNYNTVIYEYLERDTAMAKGALTYVNLAKDSLDTIMSSAGSIPGILEPAKAGYAETCKNTTDAVHLGLKTVPVITKGVIDSMQDHSKRLNAVNAKLADAFEAYKNAESEYDRIMNTAGALQTEKNAAQAKVVETKAVVDELIAEAQAVADLYINNYGYVNNVYTSAVKYYEYLTASEYATDTQRAEAKAWFDEIKSHYDEMTAAKAALENDYVKSFNTILEGYAEIKIKEVTTPNSGSSGNTGSSGSTGSTTTEDEEETTKYTSSDGQIVMVTYGGKNGDDDAPFKSFILNFNYFAVMTVYDGVVYTIPANGYVVIYH